jgi:hypothetical protein
MINYREEIETRMWCDFSLGYDISDMISRFKRGDNDLWLQHISYELIKGTPPDPMGHSEDFVKHFQNLKIVALDILKSTLRDQRIDYILNEEIDTKEIDTESFMDWINS